MEVGDLGDRLTMAVKRWHARTARNPRGDGQRAFVRAMENLSRLRAEAGHAPISGISRPMVHRYLKGEAVPPLAFVAAAADLLGVRFEWLAVDAGAPTEAEEGMRRESGDDPVSVMTDAAMAGVAKGFALYSAAGAPALTWMVQSVVMPLYLAWEAQLYTHPDAETASTDWNSITSDDLDRRAAEAENLGELVGIAIAAPLAVLQLRLHPHTASMSAYVQAVCAGLLAAVAAGRVELTPETAPLEASRRVAESIANIRIHQVEN
jgi:hypothetical protein